MMRRQVWRLAVSPFETPSHYVWHPLSGVVLLYRVRADMNQSMHPGI